VTVLGQLEAVDVFSWYDGLVIALIRATWKEGIYLASLLAWSQAQRQRVYALVPIEARQVETIIANKNLEWNALRSRLREVCDSAKDSNVAVVCCDEERDEAVAEISIGYAEVDRELLSDIDEALEPWRMRWIERVVGCVN
jgi:hypothetical protein